jgi:hypothetical protein
MKAEAMLGHPLYDHKVQNAILCLDERRSPMLPYLDLWVPLALLSLIIAAAIYFSTVSR